MAAICLSLNVLISKYKMTGCIKGLNMIYLMITEIVILTMEQWMAMCFAEATA